MAETQTPSTELTGGEGFTYEDTVVAYYLAALLREEHAAGQEGIVTSVAVQQAHVDPMDDVIVEFRESDTHRVLSLQAKRQVRITAAASNTDFRQIIAAAVATRRRPEFQIDVDAYGFATEHIAVKPLRSLQRLIDWAKSSPTADRFARRFDKRGPAAAAERSLRQKLAPLIDAQSPNDERQFYAQFVALKLDGLVDGGIARTEVINRLQQLIAVNDDGHDLLLFDRLCRIAREGAASGRKWTRQALLAQLRGTVRLKVAPNYRRDIDILRAFSAAGLADISEDIVGIHVERPLLETTIRNHLTRCRLVSLSGLPGCGKSVMLKRIASADAAKAPILFLKSDRLEGSNWLTFATALGLHHRMVDDILAEIGCPGTAVLFIDGIDRIGPDRKAIILDILRAIEANAQLANWKVLASSRDQGLEAYRAWFPASFYHETGFADVPITEFTDDEATTLAQRRPRLQRLLFGPTGVREIARRPFFAAVLAQTFPDDHATPQTEVDLISAWWARGGHDALDNAVPQRQRALLDLAETGVRKLGKNISAKMLKDSTFLHIADLKADLLIHDDGGTSYSFTHDIFFEWVLFRHLIERGDNWTRGLIKAGEPPLLGRVVGLLAQHALSSPGRWSTRYRELEGKPLRPQWRREWLTAPPFTPAFVNGQQEFQALLAENDYTLLEKLLVWFQAQHTIPSPVVLQNPAIGVEGVDHVRMADLLSWPSDFQSWARFLDWLLSLAPSLPRRLLPNVVEIFNVWQNVFASIQNARSAAIVETCSTWLAALEAAAYSNHATVDYDRWKALGGEARSSLGSTLRMIILRSACSYPDPAVGLLQRAAGGQRMRSEAYTDLMGFTKTLTEVSPGAVVAVAKAELMIELPGDRFDREERERREYAEWLQKIRAIPEDERTEGQKRALQHRSFPSGRDRCDLDDIGVDQHHRYYYPPSALHEPFASLFADKPDAALGLVHALVNHATKGWHQVHLLNRKRMGTPLPVTIEFPWGKQDFWGDGRTYSWFLGYFAPQPLECALLSLSCWAFREIEGGRPTGDVIRSVVAGADCYGVLGLALRLALETYDVSEVTLPIVTCQRLWHHDIARVVQEPTLNFDPFGISALVRLTGAKARAKEFLESRRSRKRDVRELAMAFALSKDEVLRKRFKDALARFPVTLPYEMEEYRGDPRATASLREDAERWAGLGDMKNYRSHRTRADTVLVSYQPPKQLTPAEEERLAASTTKLKEHSVIGWATQSLQANRLDDAISLDDAVAFARTRDNADILVQRRDVGEHSAQTAISAVAAVVIRCGTDVGPDYDWAWDVMERVAVMSEPQDAFPGSRIPWHPAKHLVAALVHDRLSDAPRGESLCRLFELTAHSMDEVRKMAFAGLFADSDDHVRWVAGQLAMDLSLRHRFEIDANGGRDNAIDTNARQSSLARALERLEQTTASPLTEVPPAWIAAERSPERFGRAREQGVWEDADPSFDAQFAAQMLPLLPVEAWSQSAAYGPGLRRTLEQLVVWTADRLMPSWRKEDPRWELGHSTTSLIEWCDVLGRLLARAAPFFETEFVRTKYLAPFLTDDEEGLAVIASFADYTVTRHVLDAQAVPTNTLELLNDCVERVVRDRVFGPNNYRAGEVHGRDLRRLITALLFVAVEGIAPAAARFANGDWSQISIVMPMVTRLVAATGWSPYVMEAFLTLCERAGIAYPLDAFAAQSNAVFGSIANAKSGWSGTTLPARTAATIQKLADANFPLTTSQARELLKVLDALIELGDRRSVALEQAEAFRGVQVK